MKARFLIYASLLALLPLFATAYSFVKKRSAWQQIESSVQKVQLSLDSKNSRQAVNNLLRKQKEESCSRLFSDLKALTFLEREKTALDRLFSSRTFTGNEAAEKRYSFICGAKNRLEFAEGSCHDSDGILECELSLLHPIEVDTSDIKKVLNHTEGCTSGPQLFFTDYKLKRKETGLGSEVYELNLKLLKREFHS